MVGSPPHLHQPDESKEIIFSNPPVIQVTWSRLPPETTPNFALRRIRRLARSLENHIRATLHSSAASAIHNLRVAIRRYTQALVVFEPCLNKSEIKTARRALKPVMTLAGDVRNCDIALDLIPEYQKRVAPLRRNARRALVDELKTLKIAPVSLSQHDCEPGATILREMAAKFQKLGKKAASNKSPHALHRFRILAKKYRYTLELFVRPADPRLDQVKRIQSRLGKINDYETVRAMVTEKDLRKSLRTSQRAQIEKFRKEWNNLTR